MKYMKFEEIIEILNEGGYPTKETIKAFAVKYPSLFRSVLDDEQVKKIIRGY